MTIGTIDSVAYAEIAVIGNIPVANVGTIGIGSGAISPPAGSGGSDFTYGNDANTIMLVHSDTTSGSTTFVNSAYAPGSSTITALGSVDHSTTQSKFGGSAIKTIRAGGSTIRLDFVDEMNVGSGDYTIDWWFYGELVPANNTYIVDTNNVSRLYCYQVKNEDPIKSYGSYDNTTYQSGCASLSGGWTHFAVVRQSGVTHLYNNGVQFASGTIFTSWDNRTEIYVMTNFGNTQGFDGYVDEIRVSDIARWSGAFTPRTAAYGTAE